MGCVLLLLVAVSGLDRVHMLGRSGDRLGSKAAHILMLDSAHIVRLLILFNPWLWRNSRKVIRCRLVWPRVTPLVLLF